MKATLEKASPRRERGEKRGRPKRYSGRCQLRGYFTSQQAVAFMDAAKLHGKSVPEIITLSALAGFHRTCAFLSGKPQMEEEA